MFQKQYQKGRFKNYAYSTDFKDIILWILKELAQTLKWHAEEETGYFNLFLNDIHQVQSSARNFF